MKTHLAALCVVSKAFEVGLASAIVDAAIAMFLNPLQNVQGPFLSSSNSVSGGCDSSSGPDPNPDMSAQLAHDSMSPSRREMT